MIWLAIWAMLVEATMPYIEYFDTYFALPKSERVNQKPATHVQ